ncbi:MAG: succinate dehydrogenase flavoprotein subunit [Deltaproteobacteria bacterium]|nr:succinate dehydrogenase flavoprotein subunit [Deltaproteobacteria bacterium]MBI3389082.1 succinate dehydrogenase flavoprotein subunit [Deltaproteobacteria bacterium]
MADERLIVVGGGLAGLMTTIKIAEMGIPVDLFSVVPVKRSHSVCAQGGINAAVNWKGEGDTPQEHFDDSIYGGDFLANQPPVKAMCEAGPGIVFLLDRMGVPFNRTPEGFLDFRRFGGTKHHRTAFAGATTGQQLLYALDEQVRRHEAAGLVRKFEIWEFLSAVQDEGGRCRGIIAMNGRTMEIQAFAAGAVMLATGGPGIIFGKSTNSIVNTGAAAGIAYQQGATYANGEFIQVHPTAIPGNDKLRLISESVRGEGGRVWTYKDGQPWYFLEEMYPAYGNLVPRDIATRAIFKVVFEMNLGVNGEPMVYLDVTNIDPHVLDRKLGGVLEIYEKFMGDDPRKVPMKIFPGMHYSMGGVWVDYSHMTNIPGLFAAGEVDYQYHGANRLGANSLLSCLYSGQIAGPAMAHYARGKHANGAERALDLEKKRQEEAFAKIYRMNGKENAYSIAKELGEWMTANVTVIRDNAKLRETDNKLIELKDRWSDIGLNDKSRWANQEVSFIKQLWSMLELARVITQGALRRDESRGAHYKPAFPERDDAKFLKTTVARWSSDGPQLSYEPVDTSLIKPRPRKYDVDKQAA